MSEAKIQALLRDYKVKLDTQPKDGRKVLGKGSYASVINVKVYGAECVAKQLHDILLGTHGYELVSMDQWLPMLEKFEEECKLLSKMRHPNVVQFIGVCELVPREQRTLALVMERLHTDLGRYIEKMQGNIPLPSKLNILRDTSSGLLYLHSHKVVHRDLNAGNVLLTESLRAKVADLGVARVMDTMSMKRSRNLTQTPGCFDYMPPEALGQNPEYGAKLDCFSFGHLVLYLVVEQYPSLCDPVFDSRYPHGSTNVDYQIQKRQRWIDKIDQGHCLYDLVISCLRDIPENRPEIHEIHQKLESLCKTHPWNIDQADQLEEQLTEIKETTDRLIEPMEINDLHKHVRKVDEQHERIQQIKEQVQCYQELLKEKLVQTKQCRLQLREQERQLLQHLAQMPTLKSVTETARCSQLEEQVHRLQEENAAKDLELQHVREEMQRFRNVQEQNSELQMTIDTLRQEIDAQERKGTAWVEVRQPPKEAASSPPVPMKRSNTMKSNKDSTQPPVPLRRSKVTSDQSGVVPTSGHQPLRSRPYSVIEYAGGFTETNNELERKLLRRRLQSANTDFSGEKDQTDLPQVNMHM